MEKKKNLRKMMKAQLSELSQLSQNQLFTKVTNNSNSSINSSFPKKRLKKSINPQIPTYLDLRNVKKQHEKKLIEDIESKISEQMKVSKIYNKELSHRILIHFIKESSFKRDQTTPRITSYYSFDNYKKAMIINRELIKEVSFNFKNEFIFMEKNQNFFKINVEINNLDKFDRNLILELGDCNINQFNCGWIIERIVNFVCNNG